MKFVIEFVSNSKKKKSKHCALQSIGPKTTYSSDQYSLAQDEPIKVKKNYKKIEHK